MTKSSSSLVLTHHRHIPEFLAEWGRPLTTDYGGCLMHSPNPYSLIVSTAINFSLCIELDERQRQSPHRGSDIRPSIDT